jgi:hypothetical protein
VNDNRLSDRIKQFIRSAQGSEDTARTSEWVRGYETALRTVLASVENDEANRGQRSWVDPAGWSIDRGRQRNVEGSDQFVIEVRLTEDRVWGVTFTVSRHDQRLVAYTDLNGGQPDLVSAVLAVVLSDGWSVLALSDGVLYVAKRVP